jgi:hypothetical protein
MWHSASQDPKLFGYVGSGSVNEYLMITGEVGVEVYDDAALVVLRHGSEQLRTVHLLVARGQTSPVQTE